MIRPLARGVILLGGVEENFNSPLFNSPLLFNVAVQWRFENRLYGCYSDRGGRGEF
jgi:hypothetical protein